MKVEISNEQRKELLKLWHLYGNHGDKANFNQHRFIQIILETGNFDKEKKTVYFSKNSKNAAKKILPKRNFNNYEISDECFEAVKNILLP